jgi:chemotaxis protein MotC
MTRRAHALLSVAVLALLGVGRAHGQEGPREPYELVRSLRSLQDRIARGDTEAYLSYRKSLLQVGEQLARSPGEAWNDPRNVRAAIAVVLSGGDPAALQPLESRVSGQDLTLVRAAVAYGLGRNEQALDLLAAIDARGLDPSVAGHVALVQAELLTQKDRGKAAALLAEARLFAPGTMIEEAALRRAASLAVERDDQDGFEAAAKHYFRRFSQSVHMSNFGQQLAIDIATRGIADDRAVRSRLLTALELVPASQRLTIYLAIAWEGLKGGRADVAHWAAEQAVVLAEEGSAHQLRARLCAGAALIVTDRLDAGVANLASLPADRLSREERALLAAALRIAKQIRREPSPSRDIADRPGGATEPQIVATVRSAIARTDSLLGGGQK